MHIFILCNSKYTVVFLHIEKCGAQNQCVSGAWVYWYKNGTSFTSAWSQHALLLCNITYVIGASISEPHTCGENRKWNADTSWELLNTQTPDKYPILLVLILWGLQLVWRQHMQQEQQTSQSDYWSDDSGPRSAVPPSPQAVTTMKIYFIIEGSWDLFMLKSFQSSFSKSHTMASENLSYLGSVWQEDVHNVLRNVRNQKAYVLPTAMCSTYVIEILWSKPDKFDLLFSSSTNY